MKNLEFIWVGQVAVDSGCLSVADPCYWDDERLGYEQIINIYESESEAEPLDPPFELGKLDHVGASMALVFPTTKGDGLYDVYSVWNGEEMVGFFTSFVDDEFGEVSVVEA